MWHQLGLYSRLPVLCRPRRRQSSAKFHLHNRSAAVHLDGYGCHTCQGVCPWNSPKLVQLTGERDYGRSGGRQAIGRRCRLDCRARESPSLVELMRMTRDEWDVWTQGSAIRRAGYAGFKRNVAVAMGNWLASLDTPTEEAVAVLQDALEEGEPLVQEHAAWALARARSPC